MRGTFTAVRAQQARNVPKRCWWCGSDPLYVAYHDHEWGVPLRDDRELFVKLVLDGFQAGLSWITILRRRAGILAAFDGLDPERVARYDKRDIARLMRDERIIRSGAKVRSAIANAQAWCTVMDHGGRHAFRDLVWEPTGGAVKIRRLRSRSELPAESPESRALSRRLKKEGFSFCGPVICHAYMQAVGCVNEHLLSCFRHAEVSAIARRQGLQA
jgi:DNA-3-methyladenine glycosylase I